MTPRLKLLLWLLVLVIVIALGTSFYLGVHQAQTPTIGNMVQSEDTTTVNTKPEEVDASPHAIFPYTSTDAPAKIYKDKTGFEFEYPSSWTVTNENDHALMDLYLTPPGEDQIAGSDLSFLATSTWPHDPRLQEDGTEEWVDGTAQGFTNLTHLSDGTTIRVGNEIVTKQKAVLIDGNQAILVNSYTAPDIATEPFQIDLYWLRKGNLNWYVYVSDFEPNTYKSDFDRILTNIILP
jgi:hypothetical protein